MNVLSVENLTISYRSGGLWREVVHRVSFTIKRGEMLAFVGESGSGKTTTAQAIIGLLAENEQPIVRKVFRTLQRRLREQNGLSLGYLWRSTLRDCRAQVGLGAQECDILCDAANYLGRYDADEQLTGLTQVERRLAASREAAQEDLANRGNLYRTCGIALGLLVILVLI